MTEDGYLKKGLVEEDTEPVYSMWQDSVRRKDTSQAQN